LILYLPQSTGRLPRNHLKFTRVAERTLALLYDRPPKFQAK
jgi:hypothetical protein